MRIKAVLFDLDGTLLPMNQDLFVKAYFKLLAPKLGPRGYDAQKLIASLQSGVAEMVKNQGACINEDAFWKEFTRIHGQESLADKQMIDEFYSNEFNQARGVCGFSPASAEVVRMLREKGKTVVLATNPVFPAVATKSRMGWAGLTPEDFTLVTTYENSRYCKPNLDYYREILEKINCEPEECLMIGNDVGEDMVAKELGMQVFLLTDCLINRKEADISRYPHGGFGELKLYLQDI